MSPDQKFADSSELARRHSGTGKRKAKSKPSEHVVDTGSTTSLPFLKKPRTAKKQKQARGRTSSTAECLLPSNAMTSNDKWNICVRNFQGTELSPTSDLASTSKEKGCVPFWMKHKEDAYAKLWWPTETDCVDSPLTSHRKFYLIVRI